MKVERAPDIERKLNHIIDTLDMHHIINARILCMRSFGSKGNAYARIWALPKIWQVALEINPFYVIEVLSEKFDHLPDEKKTRILIHELLHIPKRFSGGLVPHINRGGRINERTVNEIYAIYLKNINQKSSSPLL